MNAFAAAQMQLAHDLAKDNSIAICTGSGMTYINESLYLEFGVIEYLDFENDDTEDLEHSLNVAGCLLSDCADLSPASFNYPNASIAAVIYASIVALRESRVVQTFAYQPSNPRAPPFLSSITLS